MTLRAKTTGPSPEAPAPAQSWGNWADLGLGPGGGAGKGRGFLPVSVCLLPCLLTLLWGVGTTIHTGPTRQEHCTAGGRGEYRNECVSMSTRASVEVCEECVSRGDGVLKTSAAPASTRASVCRGLPALYLETPIQGGSHPFLRQAGGSRSGLSCPPTHTQAKSIPQGHPSASLPCPDTADAPVEELWRTGPGHTPSPWGQLPLPLVLAHSLPLGLTASTWL